jgi:hypothetical protein
MDSSYWGFEDNNEDECCVLSAFNDNDKQRSRFDVRAGKDADDDAVFASPNKLE